MKAEYTFNFGVVQNLAHRQIWRIVKFGALAAVCMHFAHIVLIFCGIAMSVYEIT